MKKLLVMALGITLLGCSNSTQQKIEEKLSNNTTNLNLIELGPTGWTNLRFVRPYQKSTVFTEKFNNTNDANCIWVFSDEAKVLESFELSRETIDCIELAETSFAKNKAIFLVKDKKLKERKSFKK